MKRGIYKIVSPSGGVYVGLTLDSFQSRWKGHLKLLRKGSHHCRALQRAFHKYGESDLGFHVLEEIPRPYEESSALILEQRWWDLHEWLGIKLYNGRPSGKGSVLHKEETKKAISAALKKRSGKEPKCTVKFCECGRKFKATKSKTCLKCSNKAFENEFKAKITKFYAEGFSVRAIERRLNIPHPKIRKFLRTWGVEITPRTFQGCKHSEENKRHLAALSASRKNPAREFTCEICSKIFEGKKTIERKFCSRACYLKSF